MAHHHHPGQFNRAFAISITLTLGYALLEAGYGFYSGSISLLADAGHNLGDSLGLILAWLANWLLEIPPKKRYSYGFKRTTIMAALSNAFILVATSALIAFEAVHKLFHLTAIDENIVIVVGIIGVIINGGTSLLFMRGAHEDLNIKGAFLHLLADALILAAVVVSAVIIKYTGLLWIDPVLALVIVAIVLWGTWGLLRDSLSLILDAVPRYIDYRGVRTFLENYPGVKAIHDLHIWGLSTREVALTAHLIMPQTTLSDASYREINQILHHDFKISHVTLQVEQGDDQDACHRIEAC